VRAAVVLAAGKGRRMHSDLPKVAHPVLGRPMLSRVLATADECGFDRIITVVGHGRESILPLLEAGKREWVVQERQLGTADAVACAVRVCEADEYLILLGDVPLLRTATVLDLARSRAEAGAAITVLTARAPDPAGYGRVIRDGRSVKRIVEEKDATDEERRIAEINTGLMAFSGRALMGLLPRVGMTNSQGELYLTDTIALASGEGLLVTAVAAPEWIEVAGVNDPFQLAVVSRELCRREIARLMEEGVKFDDPSSAWIEDGSTFGSDARIGRGVTVTRGSSIGSGARICDGAQVLSAVIPSGAVAGQGSIVGGRV
jgi:bifunctional UDP-N-acetylglucosamine pyrophosphorylase / glucosamine-1-phosphate N-acetyltransferase